MGYGSAAYPKDASCSEILNIDALVDRRVSASSVVLNGVECGTVGGRLLILQHG